MGWTTQQSKMLVWNRTTECIKIIWWSISKIDNEISLTLNFVWNIIWVAMTYEYSDIKHPARFFFLFMRQKIIKASSWEALKKLGYIWSQLLITSLFTYNFFIARVIEEEMFGVDNLCWMSSKATLEASRLVEFLILQTGLTAFGKAYYRTRNDLVPNVSVGNGCFIPE